VKLYLRDVFLEGEDSGKKANPVTVASNLRTKRLSETGAKIKQFSKEEWLTSQQVAMICVVWLHLTAVVLGRGRIGVHDKRPVRRKRPKNDRKHLSVTHTLT